MTGVFDKSALKAETVYFEKSALKAETVYFEKSAFYMSKMRAHVAADARVTSGALYR